MSIGAEILSALKTRLEGIRTSNSYGLTVKSVKVNTSSPTLNISAMECPLIEIVDEGEEYEHNASSSYWANINILLYLVAEKSWTDSQMQDFMSNIRKALFGGSASATGNTGVTLGGKVSGIWLVGAAADLNMIDTNRVYIMRIRLRSHRTTYSD